MTKLFILAALIIGAAPGHELEVRELGRFDNALSFNTALAHNFNKYDDLRCLVSFSSTELKLCPRGGQDIDVSSGWDTGTLGLTFNININKQ